jgi:hypothetical protein
MITIYVDGSAALQPGASNRLVHLVDADREVVLVAPAGHPSASLLAWAGHLPAMPERPSPGSWFVTADPAACGDHQSTLRTVLIGPGARGPRPTRCDVTVRDVRDAVLEILSADAMG